MPGCYCYCVVDGRNVGYVSVVAICCFASHPSFPISLP